MSGITKAVDVHLKWGNLKFFNASQYVGGDMLLADRFFNTASGNVLIAHRPFADGFVGDRLGTVERAWLIDEDSGKSLFWGDMQMAQITIQQETVFYEFRFGEKVGSDGCI